MFDRRFLSMMVALIVSLLLAGSAWGEVLDIRLAGEDSDVEQHLSDNRIDIGSSDLEFPYEDAGDPATDEQVIGMRFVNVTIPFDPDIKVLNAYIEITVDKVDKEGSENPVSLVIEGQLIPDAEPFVNVASNVTDRARTDAKIKWTLPAWTVVDEKWQSPDISPIIQEIIGQDGWAAGNALVLIVSDDKDNPSTGLREAESSDDAEDAPLLHVEYVKPVKFEIGLTAASDDAEEDVGGSAGFAIDLGSSDMEFMYDNDTSDPLDEQVVGLRFTDIGIPQGTTILRAASVRFMADDVDDAEHVGDAYAIIKGELSPNPVTFTDTPQNITSRPTTEAQVAWGPAHWSEQGAFYFTPDITPVVQEIVNQADWASGNALALIFSQDPNNPSTGVLEAENHNSGSDENPTLFIEAAIDIATGPSPADGAAGVLLGSSLSWTPIPAGTTREVYFGTTDPPPLANAQEGTSYYPGLLDPNTVYYWRVDEIEADGMTVHTGSLWSFTTGTTNIGTDAMIASQEDDGEDHIAYEGTADDGAEGLTSSDLEMPWDGGDYQIIGLRFSDLPIPPGTPISEAYVQFTADNEKLDGAPVNLIVSGLLQPDTGQLSGGENFYADRNPKTAAEVAWTDVPEWTNSQATDASRTPDLSSIVQEIVNQDGWQPGNALMLFVRDDEASPSASVRSALSGNAVLHIVGTAAKASQPSPAHGAEEIPVEGVTLSWWPGLDAVTHDVYVSMDVIIDDGDLIGTVDGVSTALTDLAPGGTYYWRVDAVDADLNVTPGNVWQFTAVPGAQAYAPNPVNGGVWQVGVNTELSWKSGVGGMIHDVYISADQALVEARDASVATMFWLTNSLPPGDLMPGTTYYWAVDEFTEAGTVAGPTWSFTVQGE